MAEWRIWFFVDQRKRNVIIDWLAEEKVPKEQIAAFQAKIDDFERGGPDLLPGFISETPIAPAIYKMKVKGNKGWKQLRPLCCRGPFAENEYTVLFGAIEKDNALPKNCKQKAKDNLGILEKDANRRRRERLTGDAKKRI